MKVSSYENIIIWKYMNKRIEMKYYYTNSKYIK